MSAPVPLAGHMGASFWEARWHLAELKARDPHVCRRGHARNTLCSVVLHAPNLGTTSVLQQKAPVTVECVRT